MTKLLCTKIESAQMQFLRITLNYTLQNGRRRSKEVRAELKAKDINTIDETDIRQIT